MTENTTREFPCPECRQMLLYPEGSVGNRTECPHCYAIVAVPAREQFVDEQQPPEAEIIEYSPLPHPRGLQDKPGAGCLLGLICLAMTTLIPVTMSAIGLVALTNDLRPAVEDMSVNQAPWIDWLWGTTFIAWGLHTFMTGLRLWSLRPDAPRFARQFIFASAGYLALLVLLVIIYLRTPFGINLLTGAVTMWAFFAIPVFLLYLYLRFSKRIKAMRANQLAVRG